MMSILTDAAVYLTSVAVVAILVKATLFLVVGLCAVWLTRRARASVRHLLLAATFATLIVLPALVLVGPAVSIEVPALARNAAQATSAIQPLAGSTSVSPSIGTAGRADRLGLGRSGRLSWRAIALTIWLAGAVLAMLSTTIDLWRVRRIVRDGLPWPALQQRVAPLAAEARVHRQVLVLRHEQVAAPFMCGLWRPTIVLPAAATSWRDEDLTRALIHELEHVRRRDWIIQCAARLACGGYWFHPLVWIAWRRLSLEAERACDDAVVQRMEGTGYAEQLVVMAQHLSRAGAPAVLGMANRSDLASRVASILDAVQPRGRAGIARIATVIGAAVLIGAAIAPVRAVVPTPTPAPSTRPAAESDRVTRLDVALVEAAAGGDVRTITALIDGGANVNAMAFGDGSPLILAAREGHLPAVQLLLDRGADVNLGVIGDGNPLIMAAREGHLDVVTLLLERGATVDQVVFGDENALIQASGRGQLDVVKLLVARGADVNTRIWAPRTPVSGEWRTPLSMAVSHRHTAVIAFLRSAGAS
jgi:beta-lactamase regulating signal transducer with metallopeptidase domain